MSFFNPVFSFKNRAAMLVFFVSLPLFAENLLPNFYDNEPHEILAKKITEAMSEEELLAQTFMFGWAGQNPGDLVLKWISERGLGSVKIFGWNTKDSYKLTNSILMLQKKSAEGRFSIPLFTATDQEGGLVRHVKGLTTDTPGNLALGASGLPRDAYYAGYYIAKELSVLGINLNFAPAVDLYTEHKSTVIGTRSFGESAQAAGKLGKAFMKGSLDAGVLATAKHFPGHGDTEIDSHGRLPEIPISKETLYSRELVPFKALIDAGIPIIMSGHINFPCISPKGEPATFSKFILNDILRKELGFDGVVVTDDIMMFGAINYAGSVSSAVRKALEAGNDIVESSKTPLLDSRFWKENILFMKENAEFKTRVKNAAYRIILLKLKYFKGERKVPVFSEPNQVYTKLPDTEAHNFFMGMAARSTTLLRSEDIPLKIYPNQKILLVSEYQEFFNAGKKRLTSFEISKPDKAINKINSCDIVIFCLSDKHSLLKLKKIIARYPLKKYFVISCLSPVHLKELPEIRNVIAVYSFSHFSFAAAFGVLLGDFKAEGKIPLSNIK